MNLNTFISEIMAEAILHLYNSEIIATEVQVQKTRKEFEGDYTLVVFPYIKNSRKSPEITATEIGNYLIEKSPLVVGYNVIKGFLNITISTRVFVTKLKEVSNQPDFGYKPIEKNAELYMIEYSSPNTNKPLHLGHIRNNLLGWSISQILSANGKKVIKTNIVNDRGIHICKSMLAWKKWGNGETPELSGKKGDHLVGEYYVKFDQEYKKQIKELIESGESEADAAKKAVLINEAQEMLRKWEAHDPEIRKLWETMNGWVYKGFEITYATLGVAFDKVYYESDTYMIGRNTVISGLDSGVFYQRPDRSVWIDLTAEGLDEKIVLRSDGTSVYITQDIGTAQLRQGDYSFDKMVYVVGNEQNYHFKVLALILHKLGYKWAKDLYHMSYGMVELPEGKMKSREGTVVDADDLIDEMISTARNMADELGKLDGLTIEEKNTTYKTIALGALKYFILKVDPIKNMTFNPKESIDFNGNTGPFIQYTYARIRSLMRKSTEANINFTNKFDDGISISEKEGSLLKLILQFPEIISEAGMSYSPAIIANYIYELAKEFNQFYHDTSILKEEQIDMRNFRLQLSQMVSVVLKNGMLLLGIEVPERM